MAELSVRLTLVSASPRRSELLAKLNQPFDVVPSHAAERWFASSPTELASSNARRKIVRSEFYGDVKRMFLGADTIVVCDGTVFGKPIGIESARRMLQALSGRWHEVVTGVCICGPDAASEKSYCVESAAVSRVCFHDLSPGDIESYVRTNEWRGKAGAYAIQGAGGSLVAQLDGDFDNVVGLPTGLIHDLFVRHFGHCRFL